MRAPRAGRGPEPAEFPPTVYSVSLTEGEVGFLAGLVQPRLVHSTVLGQILAKSIWAKLEKVTDKVMAERERSIGGRVKRELGMKVVPQQLVEALMEAKKHGASGADLPEVLQGDAQAGSRQVVQAADKPPHEAPGEEGPGERPGEKTDPGLE